MRARQADSLGAIRNQARIRRSTASGGTHEMRMRRFRVTPAVNVRLHDFTRGVKVVAIYAGAVIFVLTDDPERANRSAVSFSTAGYPGRRSSVTSSVQVASWSRKFTTIDGRPECVSGRFDVTSRSYCRSRSRPQGLQQAHKIVKVDSLLGSEQVLAKSKRRCALSAPFCRAPR
jgi:hypothetical protein